MRGYKSARRCSEERSDRLTGSDIAALDYASRWHHQSRRRLRRRRGLNASFASESISPDPFSRKFLLFRELKVRPLNNLQVRFFVLLFF